MTYLYERGGVTIEQEFPMGTAPQSVEVEGLTYKKIISPGAGILIPPYMRAPGAAGSSSTSCDKQDAYLKSNLHKKHMAQNEKDIAKAESVDQSWSKAWKDAAPALEKARQADAEIARNGTA